MRRNAWFVLVGVAFAGLLSTAAAAEKSVSPVAYEEGTYVSNEIAGLRAEIESLREQLNGEVTAGYDDDAPKGKGKADYGCGCCDYGCGCGGHSCGGCCGGCNCCCDPCCRNQGLYGGAEISWLKPHSSSGTGLPAVDVQLNLMHYETTQSVSVPLFDGTLDPDFEESFRLWLGYQRCDGLGWRLRYWEFDHDVSGGVSVHGQPAMGVTTAHGWDTYTFDFEVTDASKLGCNWDALLSFGFRYVEYDEERNLSIANLYNGSEPLVLAQRKSFEGYGFTSGVELRRALTCNLNGYAMARASVLMGDEDNAVSVSIPTLLDVTVTFTQLNDVKFIYEAQAGAELVRHFCGGHYFVRGGVEMQYWDTFGMASINPLDDGSIGFGGFFISAGVGR